MRRDGRLEREGELIRLALDRVSFRYPATETPALEDVSFELVGGEMVAVVGRVGAGASTLLLVAADLAPRVTGGRLDGWVALEGGRRGIVLPTPATQLSGMAFTVWDEVAFGPANLGWPRDEIGRHVEHALARLEIADLRARDPATLSGGELARVILASVLAMDPGLLLCDGPTESLDPAGARQVWGLLRGLAREGRAVLVATSDLDAIPETADRVLWLERGRVAGMGPVALLADDAVCAAGLGTSVASVWRDAGLAPPYPATVREARAPVALSAPLRLDRVSFCYGPVAALTDVSFALAPGERVALLGHNGAGKSTLARLIAGLLRPAAGTVWVGDWDTRRRPPEALAQRVGSLFQHADQQLFERTVGDDVRFGPRALGLPRAEVERRAASALAALELESHAREHPYDLPPALRKLAALAGTLALEPPLLVLDEPTAGLDRALGARVVRALVERAETGVALLVITHDLTFAAEALERGLVLERGRLTVDEPLAGLLVDGPRLERFGLLPPPVAALATAIALPGRPVRAADAARVLARVAGAERST